MLRRVSVGDKIYPMVLYYLGFYAHQQDDTAAATDYFRRASQQPPDCCFPNRLESIDVLRLAIAQNPQDACACYYLGNLLYDKKRHEEAIELWGTIAGP